MRTLLRHISFPGRVSDPVDVLEASVSREIAERVRAAVSPSVSEREALNLRYEINREFGIFLDEFKERADCTHTLTMARVVYILNLH